MVEATSIPAGWSTLLSILPGRKDLLWALGLLKISSTIYAGIRPLLPPSEAD